MKTIITAVIVIALTPVVLAQAPLQPSHELTTMPATRSAPAMDVESPERRPKAPRAPIARVNGVAVTQTEVEEEMEHLFPYYAIHGGRIPPTAETELHRQAIHDAVLHELVYQEARRRGLQVPAAAWQKRLQQLRGRFQSRQAYEDAARKKYGSVPAFERRLRRAMLIEQLWDSEVTRKSVVTTEAARAYYAGHKTQYTRPEAVWLQTITVKLPSTAGADQKQQARKIAEQILVKAKAAKTYEEFGALAEQLSQDDWRVMMGDHRWVHRGTVTPDLEPAVFSLKPGEVSGPVETATGYVILRANGHESKRQMSFEEMSAHIRKQLETEKRDKRSKEFERWLRSQAKVEML